MTCHTATDVDTESSLLVRDTMAEACHLFAICSRQAAVQRMKTRRDRSPWLNVQPLFSVGSTQAHDGKNADPLGMR